MTINMSGLKVTLAPPTIDMSDSLVLKAWQAWWKAVRVVEQPVSMVMLGPFRSKKWDILLEAIAAPMPMSRYLGRVSGSRMWLSM